MIPNEAVDLLAALKELSESSRLMTSGVLATSDQLVRYHKALAWAEMAIERSERIHRYENGGGK